MGTRVMCSSNGNKTMTSAVLLVWADKVQTNSLVTEAIGLEFRIRFEPGWFASVPLLDPSRISDHWVTEGSV